MKTGQRSFFLALFALLSFIITEETGAQPSDTTRFKPYGEPILRIFTNFHVGYIGTRMASAAFDITRGYFGYQLYLHPRFTAKILLDVGSPQDLSPESHIKRYAYFKNANITYHTRRFSWAFGLVSTRAFKLSEKYWNHRYIYKPYMDQYRFEPSADLGTIVSYSFLPSLSADLSITNGEGYTSLQADTSFKTGLGITWKPAEKWVLRGYGDIYHKTVHKSVMSVFGGFKTEELMIGGEIDYYLNAGNKQGWNSYGFSVSTSWNLNEHFQLFGRYDFLTSSLPAGEEPGWMEKTNGSAIITGLQYTPIKYLKIAANYRHWEASNGYDNLNWFFINLEIRY